ncbi:splicing factor 3B subunit 10-domain-containing protein [Neohortaea acidophila]|uniref:Splicing factor 3B subunit 10-domain-containing protein n=1 Tax=Neohortaea acidophila TaxID=245834 RepID=A0A6A6PWZ4_9PEZI|nr:splicing factor 3B subunit 10-domain-containing protein [Neohortaea acidophila]KAF2484219.1 splicing factor 3B subunit 10-domain-containing protein [Neohortaea acidophila]
MSVKKLTSSQELEDASKSGVSVIWIYDSDGANVGFGKKYEIVATDNSGATFYKAGHEDVKDAIKSQGLDVDWIFVFKDGQKVGDHREDHNSVDALADKLRTQQQLESLQNKFVGTGHADTTKHEWTSNIARDSYSSYQGHASLLHYMSIGMGQSVERTRMHCMEGMVLPVGPPPAAVDD